MVSTSAFFEFFVPLIISYFGSVTFKDQRKKWFIMKAIIFFIGVFFSCLTLSAQTEKKTYAPFDWIKINPQESFDRFPWEILPKGITREMVESLLASPYLTTEDPITLVYFKEQLVALIPCRFEVLRWSGDSWENLYKGTGSGFNCHAHYFVREGKLYSMGRYGFWRGHSELLEFDFETGYWEFVPVSSPPMNYGGVGIFVDGDRVFSLMGQHIHQPSNLFDPEKNGFVFDFLTRAWSPVYLDFPKQSNTTQWIYPSYDLKDYGIQLYHLEANIGLLLFHKKENTLYFAKDNNFGKFKSFALVVATGNNAIFYNKFGSATHLLPQQELWTKFSKVGDIHFSQQTSFSGIGKLPFVILVAFGLLLVVGGGLWWRKNQGSKRSELVEPLPLTEEQGTIDGVEDIARLVAKILAQPVVLVDVHQLDDLFGTAALESLDYRRVRRSRYIKAVNQYYQAHYGKELISRTKSEVDKRMILYRISP